MLSWDAIIEELRSLSQAADSVANAVEGAQREADAWDVYEDEDYDEKDKQERLSELRAIAEKLVQSTDELRGPLWPEDLISNIHQLAGEISPGVS